MRKTILLIENGVEAASKMKEKLKEKGYNIIVAYNEETALKAMDKNSIDLIIIDFFVLNSYSNGLKRIFLEGTSIEVMMSFELDIKKVQQVANSLNISEIIMKPFDKNYLLRKISNVLEKEKTIDARVWVYGDLKIDFNNKTIVKAGKKIELDNKPLKILKLLYLNRGNVLTRDLILDKLYGVDDMITDSTLNGYISTIRNVLDLECIKTIRGVGYKLEY